MPADTPVLNHARSNSADKPIWQRVRRNIGTGVVGATLSGAIKLGQAGLLARFLAIEDYGLVLIVLNLFVFLDSFLGLRVSDLMFRFFPALRENDDGAGLRKLLMLAAGICFASGSLIYLGAVVLSSWLAERLYSHAELAPLFIIFGVTILISTFSGIYEPILRLYDRFATIVIPQVIGGVTTLVLLVIYLTGRSGGYDLRIIVAIFAIGSLIQSIPPFVAALSIARPFLKRTADPDTPAISYRKDFLRCLFNSNVSGYLKLAINPGDIFLLGVFFFPVQVALYGLARQVSSPLALLQSTIQIAITPEITTLMAKQKLHQLKRLVARHVAWSFILGGALLLFAIVAGKFLILRFLRRRMPARCRSFTAWPQVRGCYWSS